MVNIGIARRLLRRHVRRRADRGANGGERATRRVAANGGDCLGDAEVGDRGASGGEQHVVGLDVAMHHAVRVRKGQSARHVAQDADHFADGERAVGQACARGLAVHVRHAEPGESVGVAGPQHRDDVRMLQLRGKEDFAVESLHRDAGEQFGRQHLDDDAAIQCALGRDVRARHPAAAEFAIDHILGRDGRVQSGTKVGHGAGSGGWEEIRARNMGGNGSGASL